MQLLPVANLVPHPENVAIYGGELDEEFVASIREHGILAPLLVAHDNRIISGHRRYLAAKQLGIAEVPIEVFRSQDELDILQALVHSNRQRVKTRWQITREAETLIEIERQRAEQRKREAGAAAGKVGGRGNLKDEKKVVENVPQPFHGTKARDEVGKALGLSGKTIDVVTKTVEVVRKLEEEGKVEQVEEIKTIMNEKGFRAALRMAKEAVQNEETVDAPQEADPVISTHEAIARKSIAQFVEARTILKSLRKLVQEILNSDAGRDLRRQLALKDIDDVAKSLINAVPVAVGCPGCGGSKADCVYCCGTNILSSRIYKDTFNVFDDDQRRCIHLIK